MDEDFQILFDEYLNEYIGRQEYLAFKEEFKKIILLQKNGVSYYLNIDFDKIKNDLDDIQKKHIAIRKHSKKLVGLLGDVSMYHRLGFEMFNLDLDKKDDRHYRKIITAKIEDIEFLNHINDLCLNQLKTIKKAGRPKGGKKVFAAYLIAENMLNILKIIPTSSKNGLLKKLYILSCDVAEINVGDEKRIILKAVKDLHKSYKKLGVKIQ